MNSRAAYGVSLPAASQHPFQRPRGQPPCSGLGSYACQGFAFRQRLPPLLPTCQGHGPSCKPGAARRGGVMGKGTPRAPRGLAAPPGAISRGPWHRWPSRLVLHSPLPQRSPPVGKRRRSLWGSVGAEKLPGRPSSPRLKARLLMELGPVPMGCAWREPAYVIC